MQKEYSVIAGNVSKKFKTIQECKKRYADFSLLIAAIAKCVEVNSLKAGEFKYSKEGESLGLKFFNDKKVSGNILVEVAEFDDDFLGVPYYSNWEGLFYRMPAHKRKPFVKNGQLVKSGQPVGVVFINKNEQFLLNAPADGLIYFPNEDKNLDRALSINVYDEKCCDNIEPMFYLK